MSCPPVHWHAWGHAQVQFASLHPAGIHAFATIGPCVGPLAGQWLVRITRKGHPDLLGRAGSLEHAKRYVERWAANHWRTV
ncbi:MAG TPA: hypothetical protein VN624_19520 [Rhodanobacter sp.]|nr:hypothetical protein [Rhodanobacter sp.]